MTTTNGNGHEVRFSEMDASGVESNVRVIKQSDLQRCPHTILVADHYRDDGSCRCDDPDHLVMAEWGWVWDGSVWANPTSYKVEVNTYGEDGWNSNGLRFATGEEAESHGNDLYLRWTMVRSWRVAGSTDKPSHGWTDGGAKNLWDF